MHPQVQTNAAPPRDVPIISICGWCNCTQLPTGQWVANEESGRLLARHEPSEQAVSHGMCPSCFALTVRTQL